MSLGETWAIDRMFSEMVFVHSCRQQKEKNGIKDEFSLCCLLREFRFERFDSICSDCVTDIFQFDGT